MALGEIKQLNTARGTLCRCGREIAAGCPFWGKVDDALYESSGLHLRDLDARGFASPGFPSAQRALFSAAAAVSGRPILVDSSKNLDRLSALLAADAFPVRVVHLLRSPYGVVYSNLKRGRDWVAHSLDYTHSVLAARRLLAAHRERVIEVRYEELADHPERELRRVMEWLDLELDPAQLRWAEQDIHTLFGNEMRFGRDSSVRRDDSWRTGLGPLQKLGIACCTLPARVPGPWLDRAQRRIRAASRRLRSLS
jgi:hypothetical protein